MLRLIWQIVKVQWTTEEDAVHSRANHYWNGLQFTGADSEREQRKANIFDQLISHLKQFAAYVGILFASVYLFAGAAYAADPPVPSYVGTTYIYNSDFFHSVYQLADSSDEASILKYALAKTIEGSTSWCADSAAPPTAWVSTLVVEGVEANAIHQYPLLMVRQDATGACVLPYPYAVGTIEIYRRRIVCSSTQRFMFGMCINGSNVDVVAAGGGNFGPPCEPCAKKASPNVGQPIEPGSGNMWHQFTDFQAAGSAADLALTRTYNSLRFLDNENTLNAFGYLWSQPYLTRLQAAAPQPSTSAIHCWKGSTVPPLYDCPKLSIAKSVPDTVMISRGDGKSYKFNLQGTAYVGGASINDRVVASFSADGSAITAWTYTTADDVVERYSAIGSLLSITDRAGKVLRLTYNDGTTNDTAVSRLPLDAPVCNNVQAGPVLAAYALMCVTDSWGHQINFHYDALGHVVEAIDPAGASHWYEYDGASGGCTAATAGGAACSANNLTKVTHPDGSAQTYFYNEAARINGGTACPNSLPPGSGGGALLNALTGVVDENGDRFMSWSYDCLGRATVSELAGGINKVVVGYQDAFESSTTFPTLQRSVGPADAPQIAASGLTVKFIQGMAKSTAMDTPCPECGTINKHTYDANGNVLSATDFNAIITSYSYDMTRNLEIQRVEASATSLARTITTTWHPTFRLPLQIAAPKLLTTYTYDANGNLLTRTEQATTDLTGTAGLAATITGAARVWTNTYNASGQILTETGPRTDVADVTTYAYDEAGNLHTVTNALGHVTTLSDYDGNGRVGSIVSPNGATTTMVYSPRGWVDSVTVTTAGSSETTTYEHDSAGQLKKVTTPDAAFITYNYDAAHRLTGIADSVGNNTSYTLDLTGNRIKEQVADPGGILARKISRVYDTLNRLKQQTGGVQ